MRGSFFDVFALQSNGKRLFLGISGAGDDRLVGCALRGKPEQLRKGVEQHLCERVNMIEKAAV
jgi:hypothetical protein